MQNPRRAAASERARTTDLDLSGAAYEFIPLVHENPAKPILHLIRTPGGASLNLPGPDACQAILGARAAASSDPNAESAWMDPAEWLGHSLPRGIPWTDYPVLGNPRHRTLRRMPVPSVRFDPRGRPGTGHAYMLPELARQAGAVVIHVPDDLDANAFDLCSVALRWVALALEVAAAMGPGVRLVAAPDGTLSEGTAPLEGRVAGHAPWLRFHYSYAANFYAIAAKALERSLDVADPGSLALVNRLNTGIYVPDRSTAATAAMVRSRIGLEHLSNPLALQALYDLRRRDGIPLAHDTWRWGWFRGLFPGPSPEELSWAGTGRRPPRPISAREAENVGTALARNHMLSIDGERLVLSATGRAFLDLLHPDCEDPDMPLRWARFPLSEADGAAMDAWIGRTFRKMKARVNEFASE